MPSTGSIARVLGSLFLFWNHAIVFVFVGATESSSVLLLGQGRKLEEAVSTDAASSADVKNETNSDDDSDDDFEYTPLPLTMVGDCHRDDNITKCGLCEGDCSVDTDCQDGLVCFIRDSDTTSASVKVPGCLNNPPELYKKDFCVDSRLYQCKDKSPFRDLDGNRRTCDEWVAQDVDTRCVIYGVLCRETCGYCRPTIKLPNTIGNDLCIDLEPFADADGEMRTCAWVEEDLDLRCLDYGEFLCKETCGYCDDDGFVSESNYTLSTAEEEIIQEEQEEETEAPPTTENMEDFDTVPPTVSEGGSSNNNDQIAAASGAADSSRFSVRSTMVIILVLVVTSIAW